MKGRTLVEWLAAAVFLCLLWEGYRMYSTYVSRKQAPTSMELIEQHGYPAEVHRVLTDDGYILTVFRIPRGKTEKNPTSSKPAIVLMHGLFSSSDIFVALGPKKSLGFQLADLGYDVWLPNIRGTKYGKEHMTFNLSDPQFWDFSCDEAGLLDLPATVDYILNVTNNEKLSYVGHSLGASLAFGLASTKQEYNKKFSVIIALAPGVAGVYGDGVSVRSSAANFVTTVYAPWQLETGHGALFPYTDEVLDIAYLYCDPQFIFSFLCEFIYYGCGPTSNLNKSNLPLITPTISSTSKKLAAHVGQIFSTGRFHKFVHLNQDRVDYPLHLVSTPVAILYSEDDYIIHPESIEKVAKQLPNIISIYKVPHTPFNHVDFIFSEDATDLVYKEVFQILKLSQKQFSMEQNRRN